MNVSGTNTLTGSYIYSCMIFLLSHGVIHAVKEGNWHILCSLYILHSSRSIVQAGCCQRQFIHVLRVTMRMK